MRHAGVTVVLGFLLLAAFGCSKSGEESPVTEEAKPAERGEEAAAKPARAPGEIVLSEVDVGPLGTLLLPEGYKTTHAEEGMANYSFSLSEDGFENLYISWNASDVGSAASMAAAKKLIGAIIGNGAEVTDESDLGDGRYKFVAKRESDEATWVVIFNAKGYLNCWGPARTLDDCNRIAESLKPAE